LPTIEEVEAENARLKKELSELKEENKQLREENKQLHELKEENRQLREDMASLKTTVSAVVARGIGAKKDTSSSNHNDNKNRKPGRKNGHEGKSRKKPKHIDARIELDQPACPKCGGALSENTTDEYKRIVEDIVPARLVVTEYVIKRRYCKRCGSQVSPAIPNVVNGGSNHERFGLRLMLLIVSLKLLGLSYAKIGSLFELLFDLDVTDAAIGHSVMKIAEAFGPRYEELKSDLRKEKSLNGDETSWRIKGKNHWLWVFVGKWSVIYEIDRSRGKATPLNVLGNDYQGTVISDSWPAWNYVGKEHQRCLQHYRRDIDDTLTYKSPGIEFLPFAKKLKRILDDAIRVGKTVNAKRDRLRAKKRFEARIEKLIELHSSVCEKNCKRFIKRLRREKGMLFTFLEEKRGVLDWNNNAAERAIRPSVVIRKITYGNRSILGANAHKVLMSIRETCNLRGLNFYDYALDYLQNPTSNR
jgi:transposase